LKNEDQSAIYEGFLERNTRVSTSPAKEATDLTAESDLADSAGGYRLPYYYFAIFDGHAGSGAAVSAANQLHYILHVSNFISRGKGCSKNLDYILRIPTHEELFRQIDILNFNWSTKSLYHECLADSFAQARF